MEFVVLWALSVIAGFVGAAASVRLRWWLLTASLLLLLIPIVLATYLIVTVDWADMKIG